MFLEIGTGAEVRLDEPGPAGTISRVTDVADGTYTTIFTVTGCPMTAEIGVEVAGVRFSYPVALWMLLLFVGLSRRRRGVAGRN